MTPQETFVTRLRRYRQRAGTSLEEIAADTRVKVDLFEALERNDLSGWPRGLYARAWIRAYASAVGLDPIDTVDEFCRLFTQGDRRVRPMIEEMAAIVAHPLEYRPEVTPDMDRRRSTPRINMLSDVAWHTALATRVVNACRAVRHRAASVLITTHPRKRQPRTSS